MSHDIDGEKAFVSARKPAWHGLGTVLDHTFTAEEALKAANLDWDVMTVPLQTVIDGTSYNVDGYVATARINPFTGKFQVFAPVGEAYQPVFNRDAFQFMDEVVGNVGGAHYETAGALRNGAQTFLTVSAESTDLVLDPKGRADKINTYLLCVNSHDGTLAFGCMVTPVRVVCANTLGMALGSHAKNLAAHSDIARGRWFTKHTKDVLKRAEVAAKTLNLYFAYVKEFGEIATHMIEAEITVDAVRAVTTDLMVADSQDSKPRELEAVETVMGLYEFGRTCENVRGTVWGGLQAVTEYADWITPVRGGSKHTAEEMRFRKQLSFDYTDKIKQRAFDRFAEMVDAK